MLKLLLPLALLILVSCASQKTNSVSRLKSDDSRTKQVVYAADSTFLLTETTTDTTYGFQSSNPVKVGGVHSGSGPRNERRFLEGLRGPNGERLVYSRAGSCCPFDTPNGFLDNSGLLDEYRVTWSGSRDTLSIYINMYDEGDLFVPVGLTAKM